MFFTSNRSFCVCTRRHPAHPVSALIHPGDFIYVVTKLRHRQPRCRQQYIVVQCHAIVVLGYDRRNISNSSYLSALNSYTPKPDYTDRRNIQNTYASYLYTSGIIRSEQWMALPPCNMFFAALFSWPEVKKVSAFSLPLPCCFHFALLLLCVWCSFALHIYVTGISCALDLMFFAAFALHLLAPFRKSPGSMEAQNLQSNGTA